MLDRSKNKKIDNLEGTMYFYPPELCNDETFEEDLDPYPFDIWALGITMFALVYLKLPFVSKNKNYIELVQVISKAELIFPESRKISDELKLLIRRMLDKNPKTRITIQEIKSNSWLNFERDNLTSRKYIFN